ncbi:FHA domain-containing protein [Paenibacillus sp. GCM10028914]|uniref:FHA domain-containing protein n=1 Tax=Paenibacillus sp. GCM10028914 TaxID=3273416 RepID=UPI00360878CD
MRNLSDLPAGPEHLPRQGRSGWLIAVDFVIAAVIVAALTYVFVYSGSEALKWSMGILSAALLTGYIVYYYRSRKIDRVADEDTLTGISKLILLNEDGDKIKEWYIQGETSVLIGKSSQDGEADVDLSDTEYSSLISRHHAVLNRVAGLWYIEDVESRNGTGIQRSGKGARVKIETDKPCKIESDDVLYIANTKLIVK